MGFFIRNLLQTDYSSKYFDLLAQLTSSPKLTQEQFNQFIELLGPKHQVFVIVNTESNQLVGTGSIFIESKLTHGGSKVAHIEDIVTDSSFRSQGLGQMLINYLVQIAKEAKCYKIILDCSDHNIPFYTKCGFEQKGFQMAKYF